jgi:hypothetical protein
MSLVKTTYSLRAKHGTMPIKMVRGVGFAEAVLTNGIKTAIVLGDINKDEWERMKNEIEKKLGEKYGT